MTEALLAAHDDWSDEDVLDVDEIQGNVLPGFGSPAQTLLGLRLVDPERARPFLAELAARRLTSLREVRHVRDVSRAVARATGARPRLPDVLLNVALAYPALGPLGLEHAALDGSVFADGMARANLQDPRDADGTPLGWTVGSTPDNTPDVLLILGCADVNALQSDADALAALDPDATGLRLVYRDEGRRLPGDVEHFGFRDGIAQPGVRGRLSRRRGDVLTRRLFAASDPRSRSDARPGQPLLWPGQFVYGYPRQLETGPAAGPVLEPPHAWMRNGSFLIFRRLRQDVAAFRAFARAQAPLVSAALGREVSPELLQAWIVGRWPDGTPLVRSPERPDPELAADDDALNFFSFALEEPDADALLRDGRVVPGAPGDPHGQRCPFFAHVRKVNLRDKPTDQGPSSRFRLLRRGIPYGPAYVEGERVTPDRGLLFLAYVSHIDPQFTTLAARWMNRPNSPEGFGHDLLVGQNASGRFAVVRDAAGLEVYRIPAPGVGWVRPTGGGYFFAPAISTLAQL